MDSLVSSLGRGAADPLNAAAAAAPAPTRRRTARPARRTVLAFGLLAGFAAASVAIGISANAARLDHQHVINLAGKQRMLTQKMTKEAVLVALGVDPAGNLRNLKSSRSLFDLTLTGLRHGDASLSLPQTSRPEILELLTRVDELWAEMDRSLQPVASSGKLSQAQVAALSELNLPLLKAMNEAVLAYEKAAYEGIAFSANAAAINLSGRQRMLTQKMTKEFLLVAYGHQAEQNRQALAATIELFDKTLKGLISGDPANRLAPAPSAEIRDQLAVVQRIWNEFSAFLRPVANDKAPTRDTIDLVAEINLTLLHEMNRAVEMYEAL